MKINITKNLFIAFSIHLGMSALAFSADVKNEIWPTANLQEKVYSNAIQANYYINEICREHEDEITSNSQQKLACRLPELFGEFLNLSENLKKQYVVGDGVTQTLASLAFQFSPLTALINPDSKTIAKSALYLQYFGYIRSSAWAVHGLLKNYGVNGSTRQFINNSIKQFILYSESLTPLDSIAQMLSNGGSSVNSLIGIKDSVNLNKLLKVWMLDTLSSEEMFDLTFNPDILNEASNASYIKLNIDIIKNKIKTTNHYLIQDSYLHALHHNYFDNWSIEFNRRGGFSSSTLAQFENDRINNQLEQFNRIEVALPPLPQNIYLNSSPCEKAKTFLNYYFNHLWNNHLSQSISSKVHNTIRSFVNEQSCNGQFKYTEITSKVLSTISIPPIYRGEFKLQKSEVESLKSLDLIGYYKTYADLQLLTNLKKNNEQNNLHNRSVLSAQLMINILKMHFDRFLSSTLFKSMSDGESISEKMIAELGYSDFKKSMQELLANNKDILLNGNEQAWLEKLKRNTKQELSNLNLIYRSKPGVK